MTVALDIGVIGAGAWGTALALVAARAGHRVTLWARRPEAAAAIAAARENTSRLAGISLDPAIIVTADAAALAVPGPWIVATPAQEVRRTIELFAPFAGGGRQVVMTAKGIEHATGCFMTDVLADIDASLLPLLLSGPSFAGDVARGLPTAVTLAARTLDEARPLAEALNQPAFRPYLSDDLIGVQIGGAVKNVLAIAAGIVIGRGLGESARAAVVARAFAELSRYGRALGAKPETLAGLSGLGDLLLTSTSMQSRNYRLGIALGAGQSLGEATGGATGIIEGAFTARAALARARSAGVDVPIIEAIADIVSERASVASVIERLLQRPLRAEV